ncbi:cupin domain-containing protein [Enterococcus plantarum]|uniref:cupin domain-containing protein n=1 Tax=Enterococcus TaxID=1350 RepID=UPI001A9084A8|nr:cupin domain-containing protein [Enterococcus plantarum]MBO0422147.1 DUF861 domain-containing protein [Enterococcus plantarum]
MKKLICAKDIEILHSEGTQLVLTDKQTIITPSAKDLAEEYHMTFKETKPENDHSMSDTQDITKDQFVSLLKKLLIETGMSEFQDRPFDYQEHSSGLKIIRGSTIKLSPLNDDVENVRYREIVTAGAGHFNLGLLEIETGHFNEEDTFESVNYVVEGDLHVTIEGAVFAANKGDVIYVPQHSAIQWSTTEKVTILSGKLKSGV